MTNKEFVKIISPYGEDRLRIRIATERGKVVNIMVQYEAKIKDVWHEIVVTIANMVIFTGMSYILAAGRRNSQ